MLYISEMARKAVMAWINILCELSASWNFSCQPDNRTCY